MMKKILKIIKNLDSIIAVVSLVIIIVITLAGVIMRYFLGKPFAWLEEMQIFFFIYTIFFGGSVAFRTGNQISIDLIANRLSPSMRRVLDIIDYVLAVLIMAYLMLGGFILMASGSGKVTPYFKISYEFIDIAAPLGIIFMIIQYTAKIISEVLEIGNANEGDKS